MRLKKFEWTYGQLGDALSSFDETVEILRGVLKNSETLQTAHPEAAMHIAAIEKSIKDVLNLKTQFSATRVEYWTQFHKAEPMDLAALAVAPFRKLA